MPNVRLHIDALSDATGVAELFISHASDGSPLRDSSSLLRPHEDMSLLPEVNFENAPITVPAVTLDDWADREAVDRIDLAWLDLQGMELPVLRAAPKVVSGLDAVCMEVSRVELYEGQALYPEVMEWMTRQGFRPAIERMSYLFGNVLFIRTDRSR